VGTLSVFRVGAEDAEFLEKEFSPDFTAEDLVNSAKYNIYLKLMIDGIASNPFSAQTLPPPTPLAQSNRDSIINASRERYGITKEIVEEKIIRWTESDTQENSPKNASLPGGLVPKKNNSRAFDTTNSLSTQENQVTLYDAVCSICSKATKTVFQPEKGRPVYCKSCLKKIKASAGGQNNKSIEAPSKVENIPFNASVKKNGEKDSLLKRSLGQERPKRKEINLSELKKALEESLEHVEEEEAEDLADDMPAEPATKEIPAEEKDTNSQADKNKKKGVINPGEKITL